MGGLTSEFDELSRGVEPGAGKLVDLYDPPAISIENDTIVTALVDRPAMSLATLKTRLGVGVATYDTTLTRLLNSALYEGDKYVFSWFTEDGYETGTQIDIPETVLRGIVAYVAAEWLAAEPELASLFARVVRIGSVAPANVSREQKGDVSISYASGGGSSTVSLGSTGLAQSPGLIAAAPYWIAGGNNEPWGF
jgi:hypothetical protein